MSMTTWDPSDTGGWRLSNANLTATSPDNNTMGAISVGYANTAIPDHARTYYEFKVSGAAIQTAFTVGFGVHGFNPSNQNIHDMGAHVANASFLGFSYNLTETNSGDVVYDPQGNWDYAATHPGAVAAPNQWGNGAIVGVMVDRINNTAQFTLNGAAQGPALDISGMSGKTLYPFVDSWFRSGPVATINGGINGFAEQVPAGYVALDGTAGGSSGASAPVSSGDTNAGSGTGGSSSAGRTGTSETTPASQTIGSGTDTLALKIAEDAYNGDAQFTISVDGEQIGGVQTATASHAAGQDQIFNVLGNFSTGTHTATVNFLNDAASATGDRNLYVDGATIDGSTVPGSAITEKVQGPQSFSFIAGSGSGAPAPLASVTAASGTNTVTVNQPASLAAGLQSITGAESDPSQPVYLDWRTYGSPAKGDSDWVKASVQADGSFSAQLNIDHAGTPSGMYDYAGTGSVNQAWVATPS